MKYKVGDRVRIREDAYAEGYAEHGQPGTIQEIIRLTGDIKYPYETKGGAWWSESEIEPFNPLEDLKVGQIVKYDGFTRKVVKVQTIKQYILKTIKKPICCLSDNDDIPWTVKQLTDIGYHLYTPRKVVKIDGKKYLSSDVIKNCKSI